jgi:hypothetical protein
MYQSQFQRRSTQSEKRARYSPPFPPYIWRNISKEAALNFREKLCGLYLGSKFLEGSISSILKDRGSLVVTVPLLVTVVSEEQSVSSSAQTYRFLM